MKRLADTPPQEYKVKKHIASFHQRVLWFFYFFYNFLIVLPILLYHFQESFSHGYHEYWWKRQESFMSPHLACSGEQEEGRKVTYLFLISLCMQANAELVLKFEIAIACFSFLSPLPNLNLSKLNKLVWRFPNYLFKLLTFQLAINYTYIFAACVWGESRNLLYILRLVSTSKDLDNLNAQFWYTKLEA